MKLNNIAEMAERVPPQPSGGIDPSVFTNFSKLGTVENYDFWISSPHGDLMLGKLVDTSNNPIAYIILQNITGLTTKHPPVRVRRTWVEPQWRNKGVMTSMYKNLVRKFNFTLISDIEFSPETESVWRKIFAALHPNIIDSPTSNIFTPTTFDEIFDNPNYSFILEWHVHSCFAESPVICEVLKDLEVYINHTELP